MKVAIMAGGKGLRFWPRSVETRPKQFLALTSRESMLQQTYRRFNKYLDAADIYIVAPGSYEALIREQLPDLDPSRFIVEPDQRDTGPCIALTSRFFLRQGLDDVLVTAPSDQYIPDDEALMKALQEAERTAQNNKTIVTLGIVPTRPETGYGYIRAAAGAGTGQAKRVLKFVEKPGEQRARELIAEPDTYWNSGIFVWKPSTIRYYMNLYQREMWNKLWFSGDSAESVYASLPKISVDYAILEKAENVYMVPVDFAWDDVGSWTSLERVFPADEQGNLFFGEVHALRTGSSIVYAEDLKVIAIGVDDLIIVQTKNGLLVCRKSEEQHIKTVLDSMHAPLGKPRDTQFP